MPLITDKNSPRYPPRHLRDVTGTLLLFSCARHPAVLPCLPTHVGQTRPDHTAAEGQRYGTLLVPRKLAILNGPYYLRPCPTYGSW